MIRYIADEREFVPTAPTRLEIHTKITAVIELALKNCKFCVRDAKPRKPFGSDRPIPKLLVALHTQAPMLKVE